MKVCACHLINTIVTMSIDNSAKYIVCLLFSTIKFCIDPIKPTRDIPNDDIR